MKIIHFILVFIFFTLIYKVESSHFRYGDIYFDRTDATQIRIFLTTGWRINAVSTTSLNVILPSGGTVGVSRISTATYGTSNGATIVRDTYIYNYSELGPHEFFYQTCCRISGIQNSGSSSFRITGIFDTSVPNNNYSPAMAIPYIWYFDISQTTTKDIPILHVDPAITYTCDSYTPIGVFTDIAISPQVVTISSDCRITVDWSQLGSAQIGHIYTFGIEATDSQGNYIQADFFLSPIDDSSIPTCTPPSHTVISEETTGISFTFSIFDQHTSVQFKQFGETVGFTNSITEEFSFTANPARDNIVTYTFNTADIGVNKFGYIQITDGKYFENCIYDVLIFPCSNFSPVLNCPADTTVGDGGNCNAFVSPLLATAGNDNCPTETVSNSYTSNGLDASGTYSIGSTVVVYNFEDSLGNAVSCSTTVTVADSSFPVINCSPDITTEVNSAGCTGSASPSAVATDSACQGSPTITNNFNSGGADATDTNYPIDSTRVVFTATDGTNFITCGTTVTIFSIPEISCPSDQNVSADGSCEAAVTVIATYTNCGSSTLSTITNDYNSGGADASDTYTGVTSITFTVSGGDTCSTTVTVSDNSSPNISCPTDLTIDTDPLACNANVGSFLASATDNCATPTITNNYTSGGPDASGNYPLGTTPVVYTATDGINSIQCSASVTVNDNTDPVINCPVDRSVSISGTCQIALTFADATATDACGIFSITNTRTGNANISDTYSTGSHSITFTATDNDGNTNTCVTNVVVNAASELTCSASLSLNVDPSNSCSSGSNTITATGTNCGGPAITITNDFSGSTFLVNYVDTNSYVLNEINPPQSTSITVNEVGSINDITIDMDITHTWMADLDISITDPSGTTIQLLQGNCGSNDDFIGTFIDSGAVLPVGSNSGCGTSAGDSQPFDGPVLSSLIGSPANGVWTLSYDDTAGSDVGTINSWGLNIEILTGPSTDTITNNFPVGTTTVTRF
eukprot:TRINITY_DN522_c0_g2_i1.p1 TRINITY_DN522_c0_g2~~TRINITY_DN522_c0_g2_i1.p1  ORF type:complete len:975 (-),score=313.51 TRINITY_DN522_c0_g2_i1:3399-6323(-)